MCDVFGQATLENLFESQCCSMFVNIPKLQNRHRPARQVYLDYDDFERKKQVVFQMREVMLWYPCTMRWKDGNKSGKDIYFWLINANLWHDLTNYKRKLLRHVNVIIFICLFFWHQHVNKVKLLQVYLTFSIIINTLKCIYSLVFDITYT